MDLLKWALISLVIALVSGGLGFTGIARGAATISRILFALFLVLAVILLAMAVLGLSIL